MINPGKDSNGILGPHNMLTTKGKYESFSYFEGEYVLPITENFRELK